MRDLTPELVVYCVAFGGCIGLLAWVVSTAVRPLPRAMRDLRASQGTRSPAFQILGPASQWMGLIVADLCARIEMRIGRDASRSLLLSSRIKAEKSLMAAGRPEGLTADDFLGLIILFAFVGLIAGLILFKVIALAFVPVFCIIFFGYLPVRWLGNKLQQRHNEIRKSLPYALDLLTISVEAGLDFTQAMARMLRKLGNTPLAQELGACLREIQLGRTRAEALRDLSRRVDLPALNSVVNALIQADELGAGLAVTLRIQSDQLRIRRSQEAEKLAMEAPVKILFPLTLFIFPTIFIMIFGPLALRFLVK